MVIIPNFKNKSQIWLNTTRDGNFKEEILLHPQLTLLETYHKNLVI
jgi:hypothetical protein